MNRGFTLIELSIVLIIVGLIAGGILVGRDLISAAYIRAQMSQIEKYQTAVHTFQTKYNCLAGDCTNAQDAGLAYVQGYSPGPGYGDGNGILQGYDIATALTTPVSGLEVEVGEPALFWAQLSGAGLIDGSFTLAAQGDPGCEALVTTVSTLNGTHQGCTDRTIANYMPVAKIGTSGVYVCAYSFGSTNYFSVVALREIGTDEGGDSPMGSPQNPGLTVQQAYAIDTKMDDGLPLSGHVITQMPTNYIDAGTLSYPGSGNTNGISGAPDNATPVMGDSTTCYDNNNGAEPVQHYSTQIDGGNDNNCALSFPFQ